MVGLFVAGLQMRRTLTPREREAFQHFGNGLTLKQVAAAMNISQRTAQTHLKNIKNKTGIMSTIALVAQSASETGLRAVKTIEYIGIVNGVTLTVRPGPAGKIEVEVSTE